MKEIRHEIVLKQRAWQRPLVAYFRQNRERGTPSHASVVAHRRAGKDRVALFIEAEQMLQQGQACEVWHCLPEYSQARRVLWHAITRDGKRLIDEAFPPAFVRRRNDTEMTIELHNGSLWRAVGADNFNSLVGSNPRHVTFSEYALTRPVAREFVRPILAENGGSELLISTPRGYNHFWKAHEFAKQSPHWYAAIHPVSQTKLVPEDVLAQERESMPEELYRQEWECDFSAANVGSILGSRVETAEREGRITEVYVDPDQPVMTSFDIGHRDAAACWFWQKRPDGVAIVDYHEVVGTEAADWIETILPERGYDYGELWLPHDARAKTFATKTSAMEQFRAAGYKVRMTPNVSVSHRINAARMLMPTVWIDSRLDRAKEVLRNWAFRWDADTKTFSRDPDHNEFSHGGDAFSYLALVAGRAKVVDNAVTAEPLKAAAANFNLDQMWADKDRETRSWR